MIAVITLKSTDAHDVINHWGMQILPVRQRKSIQRRISSVVESPHQNDPVIAVTRGFDDAPRFLCFRGFNRPWCVYWTLSAVQAYVVGLDARVYRVPALLSSRRGTVYGEG
jgi:hypothetical protein